MGRASALKCWADNIELHYDEKTGKNKNAPGVETRVPGWGSTESVEYLVRRVIERKDAAAISCF